MVHWYHAIFTTYGFWLPNDPRGSWSDFVHSWEVYKFAGPATKTNTRHSIAHIHHNAQLRHESKKLLKYPSVRLNEQQRNCIAAGIIQACDESDIALHACAIGYDHVHAVVGRHIKSIEQIVRHFKSRATKHLTREGCHPLGQYSNSRGTIPTPWAEGCWHVFINDQQQLHTAMDYVNRHPQKEGLPPQHWPSLTPV